MKKYIILFVSAAIFGLSSCVQPSSNKTVIVKLHVSGMDSIQSVGLRGSDKPLSWDYDTPLVAIQKDSLYTAAFSLVTGYKFTEVKFTVDGQFELQDQDNRRIMFGEGDTTVYEARFDVRD